MYGSHEGKLVAWREKADLVAIASQEVRHFQASAANEYRGICPFHTGATNPTSFHVFLDDSSWKFRCWGCGAKGDVFAYIAQRDGIDWHQALARFLEGNTGSVGTPAPLKQVPVQPSRLPPAIQAIWRYHDGLGNMSSLGVTGRQWWKDRGISDAVMSQYQLGYSQRCPCYRTSDSFTIPAMHRGAVKTIRHRIARPTDPGDKYRPEYAGLGAHLFNADALDAALGDSSQGGDVLVVEGEIKALFLQSLGLGAFLPIVSSTAGVSSWLGNKGQEWYSLLHGFERVIFLFDNEPAVWAVAEQTARKFGRRGYVANVPWKVDDWVKQSVDTRLEFVVRAIGHAKPVVRGGRLAV